MRLDLYLVEHAFFESRSKAKNAILDGIVAVNGSITKKCSRLILETDQVTLVGAKMTYVSKGGLKLEKALKEVGLSTEDIEKIFYKNVLRVYQNVL